MYIFHKYTYFSSFEAGNCVSNSSFKCMKNRSKHFSNIPHRRLTYVCSCTFSFFQPLAHQVGLYQQTSLLVITRQVRWSLNHLRRWIVNQQGVTLCRRRLRRKTNSLPAYCKLSRCIFLFDVLIIRVTFSGVKSLQTYLSKKWNKYIYMYIQDC